MMYVEAYETLSSQITCFTICVVFFILLTGVCSVFIFNIKEEGYKSRLHVSVNLLIGVWPASPSSSSFVRATNNTALPLAMITSGVSFPFLNGYRAPLGGWSSATKLYWKEILDLNKVLKKKFTGENNSGSYS